MKLPEIKGFIDLSLVDWDGKVSAVIFLPGCNFRCPFCYNSTIVLRPEQLPTMPFEEIRHYLTEKRGWLDGVVITGGEPTIHTELPHLCKQIKELQLLVKLDTNGTNSQMVEELIAQGLVDYIAMDIKAPLTIESYSRATGVTVEKLLNEVKRTLEFLINNHVDCEFRTTLIRTVHGVKDLKQMCLSLQGCQKYVLQNFKGDVETLDPKFKEIKPFSQLEMERFLSLTRQTLPNASIR